jgi:hypothetical protein
MSAELESAMRDLAREELLEMKRKGFGYVDGLPVPFRRAVQLRGKNVILTVWREKVREWQVRVVVQMDFKRSFGRRTLRILDGYRMTDGGSVSDISAEELDKFR